MDGMGMLLKSMGIDPEELKKIAAQVQGVATDFQTRLDRIEKKLDWIGEQTGGDEYTAKFPKGVLTDGRGSGLTN